MNMDQSDFNYETGANQPLRASETADAAVISKNETRHSYTIIMTINATEKFFRPLFLVMQESKGQFCHIIV